MCKDQELILSEEEPPAYIPIIKGMPREEQAEFIARCIKDGISKEALHAIIDQMYD